MPGDDGRDTHIQGTAAGDGGGGGAEPAGNGRAGAERELSERWRPWDAPRPAGPREPDGPWSPEHFEPGHEPAQDAGGREQVRSQPHQTEDHGRDGRSEGNGHAGGSRRRDGRVVDAPGRGRPGGEGAGGSRHRGARGGNGREQGSQERQGQATTTRWDSGPHGSDDRLDLMNADPDGLQALRVPVSRDLDANTSLLNEVMGIGTSYDMIFKELDYEGQRLAIYVVNGFFENLPFQEMVRELPLVLKGRGEGDYGQAAAELLNKTVPFGQVATVKTLDQFTLQVMAGPMGVLVDGADEAVIIDTRFYIDRFPSQPATERVMRGPQDGFIETMLDNTSLVRRRIRDPRLRFELIKVGQRSQTDVALGYIEGLTHPNLIARLREDLKKIDVDAVPMTERAIAEFICPHPWVPWPTVRFTERPDVAAFQLLEGQAVIIPDTTPEAIMAPATFFNHIHHPEDYHMNPTVGTYFRWVVMIAMLLATFLAPLWLLLATSHSVLARLPALSFIGSKQHSGFPLWLQFVGAEVSIDIIRRAILNTPGPLAATMGILGAVILGQVATKVLLFVPEVLVYMVIAAISQFAVSSLEMGMALRLVRLSLILLVAAWKLPGLAIGVLLWLVSLLSTKSFGVPYLWPLIPFNWPGLRDILIRRPVWVREARPAIYHALDQVRHP